MGLLDVATQLPQTRRELVAVEHADQLLVRVEALIGHRAPLAVLPLDHVGDYGVGVKLGIEVARGVMPEGGSDDLLVADARHATDIGIFHPGLGRVLLDPGERRRHGAIVGFDDAPVAAHQRGERDRLGRAESQVPSGTVEDLSVLAAPPELGARSVGHLAFEDRTEGRGIDRAFQPELLRPLAGPGAGLAVLGIVLLVIAVLLVVGRALGRR